MNEPEEIEKVRAKVLALLYQNKIFGVQYGTIERDDPIKVLSGCIEDPRKVNEAFIWSYTREGERFWSDYYYGHAFAQKAGVKRLTEILNTVREKKDIADHL